MHSQAGVQEVPDEGNQPSAQVSVAALPEAAEHARRVQELLRRVLAVEPKQYLFGGTRTLLEQKLVQPLLELSALIRAVVAVLEPQYIRATENSRRQEDESRRRVEADPLLDLSDMVPAQGQSSAFSRVCDMCFATRFELARLHQHLQDGLKSDQHDLVIAAESARRKMNRALSHLLLALKQAAGLVVDAGFALEAEMDAAVATRRLYRRFRHALAFPQGEDTHAVSRSLSIALAALSQMMRSPDYAEVRIHDRRLFDSLEERIFGWARASGSAREGLSICKDIESTAELLQRINDRQELQEHDAVCLADLAARLGEGALDGGGAHEVLIRATSLEGLSVQVDKLLDRFMAGEPAPTLIAELRGLVADLLPSRGVRRM